MNQTDALERLAMLLKKEPIVDTVSAQTILTQPDAVRDRYVGHARSFIVLHQATVGTGQGVVSVEDFARRLIRLIKSGSSAKGYVTGDYGYGKTSAMLYLWEQCTAAHIIAVPPFRMSSLDDLRTASYGWVRYVLSGSHPALIAEVDALYKRYSEQSLEQLGNDEAERTFARKLHAAGKLNLALTAEDCIAFFRALNRIVKEAGYAGLVVLPDELQQYIEPAVKSTQSDPIAPLFTLVQEVMTQHFSFGLIFSLPSKELGLLLDQRRDLVDRLKSDDLAINLNNIFDHNFAQLLWTRFAEVLDFDPIKDAIVHPLTLNALGQIAARPDLASGPRTVISAFKVITQHFIEAQSQARPFSPVDIVNAFLDGSIAYDGTSGLKAIVPRHLRHPVLIERLELRPALLMVAAFPTSGVNLDELAVFGLRETAETLAEATAGEIVTYRSGGYDIQGNPLATRLRLVGMDEAGVQTDWLTATFREYLQAYPEGSGSRLKLIRAGFGQLLRNGIFASGSWEVSQIREQLFLAKGGFESTRNKYPERQLLLMLALNSAESIDESISADLRLKFELALHTEVAEAERRAIAGTILFPAPQQVIWKLNLNHQLDLAEGTVFDRFTDYLPRERMTPAVLLGFLAFLDERIAQHLVPRDEQDILTSNFQPAIIERSIREIFNAELGQAFNRAGVALVGEVVKRQLEQHFPKYQTLIKAKNWRSNLKDYRNMLERLSTDYERQGERSYNASQQEIAERFGMTTPTFKTFVANFNTLLTQDGSRGWKFLLHPAESLIRNTLLASSRYIAPKNGQQRRYISYSEVVSVLAPLGYRDTEIDELITLLEARNLLSNQSNKLIEIVRTAPAADDLYKAARSAKKSVEALRMAFSQNSLVEGWTKNANDYVKSAEQYRRTPDERSQITLQQDIENLDKQVHNFISEEYRKLQTDIERLAKNPIVPITTTADLPVNNPNYTAILNLAPLQTQLISRITTAESEQKRLKQHLADLREWAKQPISEILPDDLGQRIIECREVSDSITLYNAEANSISQGLGLLKRAFALLEAVVTLQKRITGLPSIHQTSLNAELSSWLERLQKNFSSNTLDLTNFSIWENGLQSMSTKVETTSNQDRKAFDTIQLRYRTFINQSFPSFNWQLVTFNAVNTSYTQLWQQLNAVFKTEFATLEGRIATKDGQLTRLQNNSLPYLVAFQQQHFSERLAALRERNTQARTRLTEWQSTITKLPNQPEQPELLLPQLAQIADEADQIKKELTSLDTDISQIEREITAVQPTLQEADVLQKLKDLTENGQEVELRQLLERISNTSQSWLLLAGLYNKQQLRISISIKYE